MHHFDYEDKPADYLKPEIVALIASIREYKGRQVFLAEAHGDDLRGLMPAARIRSTGASNRIEGIVTTEQRLVDLVLEKTAPRNRFEEEIAGYRDVLDTIQHSFEHIPIQPGSILQLHRDLYAYTSSVGGEYKRSDNVIAERDDQGRLLVRFQPASALMTPAYMEGLCQAYREAMEAGLHDPLILIAMFILDFLCIHPFRDGNGRMSRLLTLLLLDRSGYRVGQYISLEELTEKTREVYYDALQASSIDWETNENSCLPFIRYFLGTLVKAYRELEKKVEGSPARATTKADRVKRTIDRQGSRITKREIMAANPDISKVTVERALADLVKSGFIKKAGAGPATAYIKVPGLTE